MRRQNQRILAATMALWLVVGGCGNLPMAPRIDPGSSATGSTSALTTGAGAGSDVSIPGEIIQPPQIIGPELETAVQVDGALGGTIQIDAVSVAVPPLAFSGDAQIKVTIPDSTQLRVQLEITPASKNHFDVPVHLEFDARAMGRDPRLMVIYWHDPVDNQWVPIPTDIDMRTGKVSADLAHFSEYECKNEVQGRAGW